MINYDIAVIGGGASGLAAAISAYEANSSLKIVILERLSRVGKKILATGNGRCNYTNTDISQSNYHGSCVPLFKSINTFDCEKFFYELGVIGYSDDEFRVYPVNNSATSILDALRIKIADSGIETICDFKVNNIKKDNNLFNIYSENAFVTSKSVIIAGGGMSQPNLGSDGSVIRILKDQGVRISPLYPALTAFKVNQNNIRSLKGIRTNAKVTLYEKDKKIGFETGEVQFGDGIISGICVFNLSCIAYGKEKLTLSLNLLPDMNYKEIKAYLQNLKTIRKNAVLEDFLTGMLNKRIGMDIIKKKTAHSLSDKNSVLTEKDIENITSEIIDYRFEISGMTGFEKSQVTAGGVHYSETDNFFRSVKTKNMYYCGEILDIIGDCGGYNLHFAFGSGWLAGKTCAEDLS